LDERQKRDRTNQPRPAWLRDLEPEPWPAGSLKSGNIGGQHAAH